MIYLELEGRIGNQLFMYAAARTLQKNSPGNPKIVIDDSRVKKLHWDNSLPNYPLPEVAYDDNHRLLRQAHLARAQQALFWHRHIGTRRYPTFRSRYEYEARHREKFLEAGLIRCENGYIPLPDGVEKDVYMSGFFQSEKYFRGNEAEIRKLFRLKEQVLASGYPGLDEIRNRNTVCISIKVEHNVGSKMYDVCTREYWEKAISYITEHVDRPLFFICSDNVPYVLEHFIDSGRYDVVLQSREYPVHISLGVMAQCSHFIIGNTSFGWWAQYLSTNPDKIVVAPSRWYGIDVPCDLYMDGWTTIEV